MNARYEVSKLTGFAAKLLRAGGMAVEKADVTARLLVTADMMGHDTHGLQLLPSYVAALARGDMVGEGEPDTLFDAPAASTWDGRYLPGLWLTKKGLDEAARRATTIGTATIVIRRSGHIGCLAAFLSPITDRGLVPLVASSDPCGGYVAPHGGRDPVYSPNPIAMGIPTGGRPILIDVSASTTTVGMSRRAAARGDVMPERWFVDATGEVTADPGVMAHLPPGAILPVGGAGHGHKGYGLGLMIEALTQSLSGFGRADTPSVLGASVFIQVFDPALFGGLEQFTRQSDWLAQACRDSQPRTGFDHVRMPGDAAHVRMADATAHGVPLHDGIMAALRGEAERLGVAPLTDTGE